MMTPRVSVLDFDSTVKRPLRKLGRHWKHFFMWAFKEKQIQGGGGKNMIEKG